MKHLLLLLLSCIPIFVTAQTLTEAQKQEALKCATEFCNLLVRFSNGERTLNTQINALCSGADCSAYDDIKTNKETTLRNYLMAIQQKYPTKLLMQLSQPTFDNCEVFQEYDFSLSVNYESFTGNQYLMTEMPTIEHNELLNVIVVFNVEQKMPSTGKTIERKLIYSQKSGKITAFVCSNSPILSYSKGLDAFARQEYKKAVDYFEEAINNGGIKFAGKRDCYIGGYVASVLSLDFNAALKYANLLGDIGYILNAKGQIALREGRLEDSYNYYKQLESELLKGTESFCSITDAYFILGILHCMPKSEFPYYDSSKATNYLKKCVEADGEFAAEAAQMLYIAWIGHQQDESGGISEKDMTYSEALSYLRIAANKNYPSAFLPLAIAEHFDMKNKEEAIKWYEKSAKNGNVKAMALLGKVLITEPEFSYRKKEGIEWLKKSLEGDKLEIAIDEFGENVGRNIWPNSREEVQQLLRQVSSETSYISPSNDNIAVNHSNAQSQSASQSNMPVSSYGHSNTNNSSNSYSYRHRHKFNEAKVGNFGSLSAGYIQKQWTYDFGGVKEKYDVFGEDKYTNGIQFGIRTDPQFGYGFGINTGLFYEYFFDKSEELYEDGLEYYYKSEEHSLYLPVHLKYSLNFSKWFQLAFYGGVGLDYGLSGKIYLRSDGETLDTQNLYDDELDMKRFNASLEYGAAIRIDRIQLNFTTSQGLIDMSGNDEYKVKQNKLMTISASVYF